MFLRLLGAWLMLFSFGIAAAQDAAPTRDYWPTDGWHTAAPEAQNMDAALLDTIPDFLTENNLAAAAYSVLVVRGGYVVYEAYFNGYEPSRTDEMRSVTKSVTSALVGIALERGDLPSLDMRVVEVFPQSFADGANADKRDLSLRHLLMMRSGLKWNDGDALSLLQNRGDQMERLLNLPLVHPPGETWNYSTGDSHLISGLFQAYTGRSLSDYAAEYLFAPLGITSARWDSDSHGYNSGGMGLALSPRDMAKFGYLYLNNGVWDGQPVVPADWIALTTAPQDETVNWYGYQWWRILDDAGHEKYPLYAARGYAGDNIFVYPALDLVVVTKTKWRVFGPVADRQGEVTLRLVDEVILPAVQDAG